MDNVDNNLFAFASELLLQDNEQSPFPSWGEGINNFEELSVTILDCYTRQLTYEIDALHNLVEGQQADVVEVTAQYNAIKALEPSEYPAVIDSESAVAKESLDKLITEIQEYMRYMQNVLKASQDTMANPNTSLGIKTLSAIVCQHAPNIISGKNNQLKVYVKQRTELDNPYTDASYEKAWGGKRDTILFTKVKLEKEIEQNTNKIKNLKDYIARVQTEISTLNISEVDKRP